MMLFPTGRVSGAVFSEPVPIYRYELTRQWGDGPRCNFIMLNPSTADAAEDDPTVRRCIGYAKRWGYGSLIVTNIFALRSTDPKRLVRSPFPVGPENDHYILHAAQHSNLVVCAWGTWGHFQARGATVMNALRNVCDPHILTLTKDGYPCHPLYLKADLHPFPYDERASHEHRGN